MTDLSASEAPPRDVVHDDGHDDAHEHNHDMLFVRTAVFLAIITAIEVAWSYLPVWKDATGLKSFLEIGGLFVMMAIKFVMVTMTFMHLRFDNKLLTRVFYFGLALAISVYVAVLFTFELFGSGRPGFLP